MNESENERPVTLRGALDDCWRMLGAEMIGRTYRFADTPTRTFKVSQAAASAGRVEIVEKGYVRRYMDLVMLARCLHHGVLEEVAS